MATVNRWKYLTQKSDARMNIVIPIDLKKEITAKAEEDKINVSQWVKIAMIEKLNREAKDK